MTTLSQVFYDQNLTSCRAAATSNISAQYFNGNDGIGATLTLLAPGTLTIDTVLLEKGDRVAVVNQTNSFENGIYILITDNVSSETQILQRTDDFCSSSQMTPGSYCFIYGGSQSKGLAYTLVEPYPQYVGISPIVFGTSSNDANLGQAAFKNVTNNTLPNVVSIAATPVTDGNAVKFSGINGSITDSGFALDQACAKSVTDNTKDVVVSLSDTGSIANYLPVFADANGSIKTGPQIPFWGVIEYAGGAAQFDVTVPDVLEQGGTNCQFKGPPTNPAGIEWSEPHNGKITIQATANPGPCFISWQWYPQDNP